MGPLSPILFGGGAFMIVIGVYWYFRLSNPDVSDKETEDGDRLIHVEWGTYESEEKVLYKAIAAIIFGAILIVVGLIV